MSNASFPALALPKKLRAQWFLVVLIEILTFSYLFFLVRGTIIRGLELAFLIWLIVSMLHLSVGAKRLLWIQTTLAVLFFLSSLVAGLFLSDGPRPEGKDVFGLLLIFVWDVGPFLVSTIVALLLYSRIVKEKAKLQAGQ